MEMHAKLVAAMCKASRSWSAHPAALAAGRLGPRAVLLLSSVAVRTVLVRSRVYDLRGYGCASSFVLRPSHVTAQVTAKTHRSFHGE